MTSSPNPDAPDTEGKTIPPYDGRRESADVDGPEKSVQDGAKTAGATGPVEDDAAKAAEPADTDLDPDVTTGASHEPGTGRAEDKS